ncbi:hypothetical protein CPC08DRAFT_614875, partial [Agrocybe pediades]
RSARKGGIEKRTALCDCCGRESGRLDVLEGADEITVLYQLSDLDRLYFGYHEGVVDRFSDTDVRFHRKLQKPVMIKRSSVAASTIAKSLSPSTSSS